MEFIKNQYKKAINATVDATDTEVSYRIVQVVCGIAILYIFFG